VTVSGDVVTMSVEDMRELAEMVKENEKLKKELEKKSYRFYLGGNAGTYGVGLNAGIIL
jgi:hypothetical protein